jgi:hypothetical protein
VSPHADPDTTAPATRLCVDAARLTEAMLEALAEGDEVALAALAARREDVARALDRLGRREGAASLPLSIEGRQALARVRELEPRLHAALASRRRGIQEALAEAQRGRGCLAAYRGGPGTARSRLEVSG